MYELNLKEKKDEKVRLLKQLSMKTIPRIGETVVYDKSTYKVVGIEYDIPMIGDEIVNVLCDYQFSTVDFEVPE